MIALEIAGFLLLVWLALELCGLGLDWVAKHRAELMTGAVVIAALWGGYALFGPLGVWGAIALLAVVAVVVNNAT